MARAITIRVAALLATVTMLGWPDWQCDRAAIAQGVPVDQSPGAQPMWTNQSPMSQVGPNGAVYIDQPTMMYGGAPPATCPADTGIGGQPCSTSYSMPCPPQVCPAPTTWTMPVQPLQVPCPPPLVQPPPVQWTIFGDVLWLHPTGADMAHAQQQNGIGGAGTVPFGLIGVADPGYDIGFRVGGELQFDPCAAVFVSYTFFEETSASVVASPVIPGGGGAVGSLVHHPGTALTASVGPVNATYDIDFQLGDAAYRQFLVLDSCRKVSVFAGGRFGQLDQDFLQSGVFGGGLGGAINTTTNIGFTGGGPMVGIDAERQINASGFSVYGRALAAALTGQFDSHYRMFNTTTGTLLAEANWQDDRIVPMFDYELGLAWTGPQGHLRLAVGYMASHWFNVVTTPAFVSAVRADNYVDVADTISFAGPVGHAEIRW